MLTKILNVWLSSFALIKYHYHFQEKSRYENEIHILRLEIKHLQQTEKEKLQKLKEKMDREKEELERKNQMRIQNLEKEKVRINIV